MLAAMYRECLHHFHESVCHDFLLSLRNWNEHYLCRCSDEIFKEKAICYVPPFLPSEKYNPVINICLVHESDVMLLVWKEITLYFSSLILLKFSFLHSLYMVLNDCASEEARSQWCASVVTASWGEGRRLLKPRTRHSPCSGKKEIRAFLFTVTLSSLCHLKSSYPVIYEEKWIQIPYKVKYELKRSYWSYHTHLRYF